MGAHSPRAAAAGGSPAPALRVAALLAAAVVAATFAFINTSSSGQGQQAALAVRLANSLHSWAGRERGFQTPHSRCSVLADGTVEVGATSSQLPFLFDVASMPNQTAACEHCSGPDAPQGIQCCGVCLFDGHRCAQQYPGGGRSEKALELLLRDGLRLHDFTPCELFARIRGRTLWFMGDSQTWAFFLAAECFLREFAPSLRRTPAVEPPEANQALRVVGHISPPFCLGLAQGTRICVARFDFIREVHHQILARLVDLVPGFRRDIVVLNSGLHYPEWDHPEEPATTYLDELQALAEWRAAHAARLPALVWADTGPQHFFTREGTFPPGGKRPFKCRPLEGWYKGDPVVAAGTRRNRAVAPLVPALADAHLRLYNATVPLWESHLPGECSHWCHPSAYQLWTFLLNGALRDSGVGSRVQLRAGSSSGRDAGSREES